MPRDVDLRWMEAAGLDQSVRRRGLAVMQTAAADMLAGTPGIRVLETSRLAAYAFFSQPRGPCCQ